MKTVQAGAYQEGYEAGYQAAAKCGTAMSQQELTTVLDDLARKVAALVRTGKPAIDSPEMKAILALEAVYPDELARWYSRVQKVVSLSKGETA